MVEILVEFPDGKTQKADLVPGDYRVGSSPAAHLQIKRPEISSRHALFHVKGDSLAISDSESAAGTFLDGVRVGASPTPVAIDSVITIGEVKIKLLRKEPAPPPQQLSSPFPNERHTIPDSSPKPPQPRQRSAGDLKLEIEAKKAEAEAEATGKIPILRISGIPLEARPIVQEIKRQAHIELLKRLNLKRMAVSGISQDELEVKTKSTIHDIISEINQALPYGVTKDKLESELLHEAIGLGPLEDLIQLDEITEIMVNGPNNVFVERKGVLFRTDTAFAGDHQVQSAIERIVSPLGRRIDESSPMVDARLPDGSRVNAIIPPLSLIGPTITIRKFSKDPFLVEDLIGFKSLTKEMAQFLDACVKIRKNIIISGGTGSGKTTLLNVLSSFLPNRERILTIEDAAELQLKQDHVVRLEARPPNIEGKGAITIRDLVRNSLRMRPDRIVVGECRGGEALDMLQAMNTGHDGSLTTVHANTPRDALTRLETLVLMAGFDLPLRAIREQIASAVDIVVQTSRIKDGSRKVTHISEITKMEGDIITMQEIFKYELQGWGSDNKLIGRHKSCNAVPTFLEDIKRSKIPLDISIFTDKEPK